MHYVYRLQSLDHPSESYIGTTSSVKKKLAAHNRGKIERTASKGPWRISFYAAFTRGERAKAFAAFLKTSEGKSFGREHLWSSKSSSSTSSSSGGL